MARKLHSPDQPLLVQGLLRLYAFSASLKLAVVLIFACALTLAWATFVESEYGTPAVQFGVYGSWWFELLNLLLAVNILAAALIRFPWKRHQTGFVITHLGLLTLLAGCLVSRLGAIDAQMPIFEDDIGHRAYTDHHNIELTLLPLKKKTSTSEQDELRTVISIPFKPGPFSWHGPDELFAPVALSEAEAAELAGRSFGSRIVAHVGMAMKNLLRRTSGLAFSTVGRSEGVVYDQDGIQVEVLDYYADSKQVEAPLVKLMLSMPQGTEMGPDGKPRASRVTWIPVELHVPDEPLMDFPHGRGTGRAQGGGRMTFRLAGSQAELDAFLASAPQGDVPGKGQLVLSVGGEQYPVNVEELLAKKKAGERLPLGQSGTEVELVQQLDDGSLGVTGPGEPLQLVPSQGQGVASGPAVELKLHRPDGEPARLVLFAQNPEVNIYDHRAEVFGTYWHDPGELTAAERMQGKGGARIDFVQGPDQKLYRRYWSGKQLVALGEMPTDGTKVDAFKMPIAQLQMYVAEFVPSLRPTKIEQPLPFRRDAGMIPKRPAAKLRVTVDGKTREFWVASMPIMAFERAPVAGEQQLVAGEERLVSVTLPPHDIFKAVGFQVRLDQFQRRLDPGTSQPSHYGSTIDILARDPQNASAGEPEVLLHDVEISMNAPVDIVDPATGRTLRLFQESFQGPYQPGDPIYRQFADKSKGRELFYASILTVNYDPGRGIKYAGSLLIVAGIFTMFYMRAYFFKPAARAEKTAAKATPAPMEPVA